MTKWAFYNAWILSSLTFKLTLPEGDMEIQIWIA